MAPGKMNLDPLTQGDTFQKAFEFKDQNNLIMDISGFDWWLTIKLDPNLPDDSQYAAQTVVRAGQQNTMSNGSVTMTLTKDQTAGLIPNTYFWELQRVKPITEGENDVELVTTLLAGFVEILPQLTQAV